MMKTTQLAVWVSVIVVAMTGIASAKIDRAESTYKGWTARAWAGSVGRYVEDDTVTFNDPTFGDVTLDVDGSSLGIGFDVERRFNKLLGLDLAVGYTDMDIAFEHSNGTGTQVDSLSSLNIFLALNFHLINTEKVDFYIAPQIAYVAWLNDLSYNVPGTGTYNFGTDNEFPSLGLALGLDWWITEDWALNAALRFIDADADSDHDLPIDQTFVTLGIARNF